MTTQSVEFKTLLNVRLQLLVREGIYNGRMLVDFITKSQHLEWYDIMAKLHDDGLLAFAMTDLAGRPIDKEVLISGDYDELCYQLIRVNQNRMKEYLYNKSPNLAFFKVRDPDHTKELCDRHNPDIPPAQYSATLEISEAGVIITAQYEQYIFPVKFQSQVQKILLFAMERMNKNLKKQEFRFTRQELMDAGFKFKKGQSSLATIFRNNQLMQGVLSPFATISADSLTLVRSIQINAEELQRIKTQSEKYKF